MSRLLPLLLVLLLAALPAGAEEFLSGKLLVASPHMPANPFAETVILVCSHDGQGAFGLVVNRSAGQAEADSHSGAGASPAFPLRLGGPVETKLLFLLMTAEAAPSDALMVPGGFAVGNPSAFLAGERPAPRRASLMVGYAGWTAGQLEAELARGDWMVQDADEETVFGTRDDAKWRRAVTRRETRL